MSRVISSARILRVWVAVSVVGGLASAPAVAAAQRTVILPVVIEGDLDDAARTQVRDAIGDQLRASAGDEIEWPERIVAAHEQGQLPCANRSCAEQILSLSGANLLVEVRLDLTPAPGEVVVLILDRDGGQRRVRMAIGPGPITQTVRAAVDECRSQSPSSTEVTVRVTGTPAGATVSIDGEPRGTLPYEGRISTGSHHLLVSAPGRVSFSRDFEATEDMALEVELMSTAHAVLGSDTWPSWLLAGALAAAGIAVAAVPIPTLLDAGQCVDAAPGGGCLERVAIDGRAGALLGVGGALIITGIVFAITQPIAVQVSASPESAQLRLRGSF